MINNATEPPDNAGGLSFESEENAGVVSNRHYISAGGQSIGVLVSTGALPTLAAGVYNPPSISSITLVKVEYWHKDQLGSLVATTDHTGAVTARYSYDPFGKRRTASGNYDANGTLVVDWNTTSSGTDRGYTGHEHLDDLGVIHMNGRLFDPRIGMFMQGDPHIQDPLNLQNFNRYGYCYNNPMTCTDPSGQIFGIDDAFWIALAVIWGAEKAHIIDARTARTFTAIAFTIAAGIPNGYGEAARTGFVSGAISSGNLKGALQGSFTSMMFYGVGQNITDYSDSSGITDKAKFASAIAAHGVVGCVDSVLGGGKCGPGALSAAFSKAALPVTGPMGENNPVAGTIISSVIGGTASVLGGGKFANGAQTAAFGYVMNALTQAAHARLVAAGTFLGGTGGFVVAGACAVASSGICGLGAPALMGAGAAIGGVSGEALFRAFDQLDNLLSKVSESGPQAYQYALLAERDGLYPTVRGDLVFLNKNDVWKYGMSTVYDRYPVSAMQGLGVRMEIQARGTISQVYVQEKSQLINYVLDKGELPPGNRIFK